MVDPISPKPSPDLSAPSAIAVPPVHSDQTHQVDVTALKDRISLNGQLFAQNFPSVPQQPNALFRTNPNKDTQPQFQKPSPILQSIIPLLDQSKKLESGEIATLLYDLSLILVTQYPQLNTVYLAGNLKEDIDQYGLNKGFLEVALNIFDKALSYGKSEVAILVLALVDRVNPAIAKRLANQLDISSPRLTSAQMGYWFVDHFLRPHFFPNKSMKEVMKWLLKKPKTDLQALLLRVLSRPASEFGQYLADDYLKAYTIRNDNNSVGQVKLIKMLRALAFEYRLQQGLHRMGHDEAAPYVFPADFSFAHNWRKEEGFLTGFPKGDSKQYFIFLKDIAFADINQEDFFDVGAVLVSGNDELVRHYYTPQTSDMACDDCVYDDLDDFLKPLRQNSIKEIQQYASQVLTDYQLKLAEIEKRNQIGDQASQYSHGRNKSERTRTFILETMPGYWMHEPLKQSHQDLDESLQALQKAETISDEAKANIQSLRDDMAVAASQADELDDLLDQHYRADYPYRTGSRQSCFQNQGEVDVDCLLPVTRMVFKLKNTMDGYRDFIESGTVYDEKSFYQQVEEANKEIHQSKVIVDRLVDDVSELLADARRVVKEYQAKLTTIESEIQKGKEDVLRLDTDTDYSLNRLSFLHRSTGFDLQKTLDIQDLFLVSAMSYRNTAQETLKQSRANVAEVERRIAESQKMDERMQAVLDKVSAVDETLSSVASYPPNEDPTLLSDLLSAFTTFVDSGKVFEQGLFHQYRDKSRSFLDQISEGIESIATEVEQVVETITSRLTQARQENQAFRRQGNQGLLQEIEGLAVGQLKDHLKSISQAFRLTLSEQNRKIPFLEELLNSNNQQMGTLAKNLLQNKAFVDQAVALQKPVADLTQTPPDFKPAINPIYSPVTDVYSFNDELSGLVVAREDILQFLSHLDRTDQRLVSGVRSAQANKAAIEKLWRDKEVEIREVGEKIKVLRQDYTFIQDQIRNQEASVKHHRKQVKVKKDWWEFKKRQHAAAKRELDKAESKHREEKRKYDRLVRETKSSLQKMNRAKYKLADEIRRDNYFKRASAAFSGGDIAGGIHPDGGDPTGGDVRPPIIVIPQVPDYRDTSDYRDMERNYNGIGGSGLFASHANEGYGVRRAREDLKKAAENYKKAGTAQAKQKVAMMQAEFDIRIPKAMEKHHGYFAEQRKRQYDQANRILKKEEGHLKRFRSNLNEKGQQIQDTEAYLSRLPNIYQQRESRARSEGQVQFSRFNQQSFEGSYQFFKGAIGDFNASENYYNKKDGRQGYTAMVHQFELAQLELQALQNSASLVNVLTAGLPAEFRQSYSGKLERSKAAVAQIENTLAALPQLDLYQPQAGLAYANSPHKRYASPEMHGFLNSLGSYVETISQDDTLPHPNSRHYTVANYRKVFITDLSYENGGKIGTHKTHRDGNDVDLSSARFNMHDKGKGGHYDPERVRRVMLKSLDLGAKKIRYGDKNLIRELQRSLPPEHKEKLIYDKTGQHDKHLHVEL